MFPFRFTACVISAMLIATVVFASASVHAGVISDFDLNTTPYVATQHRNPPAPAEDTGGPDGRFIRVINDDTVNNQNTVAFDRTVDGGVSNAFRVAFDFRMDSNVGGLADGMSVVLLPTSNYGNTGAGTLPSPAETGRIANALGIGLGAYDGGSYPNTVLLAYDNTIYQDIDIPTGTLELADGNFHRAEVIGRLASGGTEVSVTITPDVHGTPGTPIPVITDHLIADMLPYDYRVQLAGRTGGSHLDGDFDNIEAGVAAAATPGPTQQDFEGGGSPFQGFVAVRGGSYDGTATKPSIENESGPGNFLRLAHSENWQYNYAAFDRTAEGQYGLVTASFDMRMSDRTNSADGGSFVMAATGSQGTSGALADLDVGEAPGVDDSFGLGFDIHYDIHNAALYWDGAHIVTRTDGPDYRDGVFHDVDVTMDFVIGGANVSVSMDGTPIFTNEFIAGMTPYEARAAFGARTGGATNTMDIDNVDIQYTNNTATWVGGTGDYTDNANWLNDAGPSPLDGALIDTGVANYGSNMDFNSPEGLTVTGTGELNVSGRLRVATGVGETSSLTHSGSGRITTTRDFWLGDNWNGPDPDPVATYDISGDAVLTVGGVHTVIGRGGEAHVTQSDNASVSVKRIFIHENDSSSVASTWTISGGELHISDIMQVGRHGAAEFTQTGGTVDATGTYTTGTGNIEIGRGGSAVGTYDLQGGTLVVGTLAKHATNGTFNFDGGTLHAGTVDFLLENNGGILGPGGIGQAGTTAIDGGYTQDATGTLAIDLGGTGAGLFDLVEVTGDATLDGLLDVDLIDGFVPQLADTFTIMTATGTITDNGLDLLWDGPAAMQMSLVDLAGGGQALVLENVPEPGSLLLLALGGLATLGLGRRRRPR